MSYAVRNDGKGWRSVNSADDVGVDETYSSVQPVLVSQPPPIAPISPRQIRQALTRAGLRAAVEAAVAAGDQDLKDWYEFSTAFERNNAQVIAMGVALSVSPSSLDDLWALGASL